MMRVSAGWAGQPVLSARERRRLTREEWARLERRRLAAIEEQAKRTERRRARETAAARRRLAMLMELSEAGPHASATDHARVDWDDDPGARWMKETCDRLTSLVRDIPEDLRRVLGHGLLKIEETLRVASEQGYDPYLCPSLRAAERELDEMLADGRRRLADWAERLRRARVREDMTISRLRVVIEDGGARSVEAETLAASLESLDEMDDPFEIEVKLRPLESRAEELIAAHEEDAARAAERAYVESSFREVLTRMGYRVLDVPDGYLPPGDAASDVRYYLTPEGEALRVETAGDAEVRWRLMRLVTEGGLPEPATEGEMIRAARAHCHRAHGSLGDGLGSMGIKLVEALDRAPEDEGFGSLVIPEGRLTPQERPEAARARARTRGASAPP